LIKTMTDAGPEGSIASRTAFGFAYPSGPRAAAAFYFTLAITIERTLVSVARVLVATLSIGRWMRRCRLLAVHFPSDTLAGIATGRRGRSCLPACSIVLERAERNIRRTEPFLRVSFGAHHEPRSNTCTKRARSFLRLSAGRRGPRPVPGRGGTAP
jgi:hypothetical protein